MLIDFPVDYSIYATQTVAFYVTELKECSVSKKIVAENFLLPYSQKKTSFTYDKTFDGNEDDEGYASANDIRLMISQFEKQFNMTSEEFLQLRNLGKAPDTFETMLWKTLLKAI